MHVDRSRLISGREGSTGSSSKLCWIKMQSYFKSPKYGVIAVVVFRGRGADSTPRVDLVGLRTRPQPSTDPGGGKGGYPPLNREDSPYSPLTIETADCQCAESDLYTIEQGERE